MRNPRLQAAAREAVRHEGIDAVILFGSRARGDTHGYSDWDLCVVGTREPRDIESTLGLGEEGWDEATRVDVLWRHREALREDTSAGTVWADVVRNGQIMAGDQALLTNIEIKPMKMTDIERAFMVAAGEMETAVNHASQEQAATGQRKTYFNIKGTEASAAAAEHLSRGVLGALGLQPGGGHDVATNADILRRAADTSSDSARKSALQRLATAIEKTDGGTHAARGATYSGTAEPRSRWEKRIEHVAETFAAVIEGATAGTGEQADLAHLPESATLRRAIAGAAETGAATARAVEGVEGRGTAHLRPETREALTRLKEQWDNDAVAKAHTEQMREPDAQDGERPAKPDETGRAGAATRVHQLRAKHPDPAVRTRAHLDLAALEPDAESAVRLLREALAKDPEIAQDAKLAGELAERAAETRTAGHAIGREAALKLRDNPQMRAEAHEATERRPSQPKGDEARGRRKHEPKTPGEH